MAIRGEIVIECDTPSCHAETHWSGPEALVDVVQFHIGFSVEFLAAGWRFYDGKFVCPQCIEERK
jgi:hypothetical protein